MSAYKIAVCDDVAIERDMLCLLLQQYDKGLIIRDFSCGEDLLGSHDKFDLVFMDIYMNGMTGMQTAKHLKANDMKTPIVFLTSSTDFAVESYEINAFDYIVKPLQSERLKAVWKRFVAQHKDEPKYYILNNTTKTQKLPYEKIEFLESDCHYVSIHMADGTSFRVLGKLDDFERELNDARFLRCHKSYLINLDLTKALDEDFLMSSGELVPYRKRDKKNLQKLFSEYAQN